MNASTTLKKFGLEQAFHYIYKDPEKNMLKIMDWADKFAEGEFVSQRRIIREIITNPAHPYYSYVRRLFTDVDSNVTKTLAANFFINAGLIGWPKEEALRKKYRAYFVWYFHYMPVGNDAAPRLMPAPEQRRGTYERIRRYRSEKPLFAMDFQNDAEYVGGCIAGGRRYLHINANGDIDPCVFVHYSDSNIREKTLLEALRSPMMMAYHDRQPFHENMMRPCPMLENPEKLREMVACTGAHSTDLQSPESADHLCSKCDGYAQNWKPVAEELWAKRGRK